MKVWEIGDDFGLDNLRTVERPEPSAGPGQIKLRMQAASINYRDLLMVRGEYNPRQPLPLVPCSDGVGEVVEVGEGVSRFEVGESVCPTFFTGWAAGEPTKAKLRTSLGGPVDGTLQEYMVVPESAAVLAPPHLRAEHAAALPCAAVTAWSALVTQGGVTAGEVVLCQGTGGVSVFAMQIAKALGARVIATSSSDEKLELVRREIGVEHGINYAVDPEWGRIARGLAGGDGVDHVVEVGGAGTLAQSLRAIRPGGQISLIGVLAGRKEPIDIAPILMQNVRVQGVIVGATETFEAMNRAFGLHQLRPIVDAVYDFDEVPAAFAYLAEQRHVGKICVRF